ncbi:HlyD family secretion protein [gamma proteobacterium HdN1]|nr:HlyD family secretion protein [gamma proteobacterium HdN1]
MFSTAFRPLPIRAIFLIGFAATLSACDGKQSVAAQTPATMPPMPVEVVTVTSSTRHRTVNMPTRLQAIRTAEVRARVDGILEERVYREGSQVHAGDVLFRINPEELAANAAVAQATVAEREADAKVAAQTLERMRSLLKSNAISSQQYDEAVARQAQAEAGVSAAKAALRRSEIDLKYATVRAPISGHAGRALVTEGVLVSKVEATPLTTIEQTNPIQANFSQASADYLRFRKQMFGDFGSPNSDAAASQEALVELILEDGSVYPHKGRLLWAEVGIDSNTGSVLMRAEFPNPDGALLPGQFAGIRLPFAAAETSLTVPQRAVMAAATGQFVYRVNQEHKVEVAPIAVGGLAGNDWLILSGLSEGDQVIINGLQKVRPGATVNPIVAEPQQQQSEQGAPKDQAAQTATKQGH